MRRGTTPTISVSISDVDYSEIEAIYVTIEQKGVELTKEMIVDLEEHTISTTLTQEEALSLKSGSGKIQFKLKFNDGSVSASDITRIKVDDILNEEVI